jgi:hypothetical protein
VRVRAVWLSGAAIVLGACAAVIAVTATHAASPTQSGRVALPRPHTVLRDGHTYVATEIPALGARLVPSAGPSVSIVAEDSYDRQSEPVCNQFGVSARVVSQNDTAVRIATFAYRVPKDQNPRVYACTRWRFSSPYRWIALPLVRPLGARQLVDDRTGRQIGILDPADLPVPSYIPDGFGATSTQRFDDDTVEALRTYTDTDQSIEVSVRSASARSTDGATIGHADVGGFRASIVETTYDRCVVWMHPAGLVNEVCSFASSKKYLSAGELLKIARSLH